MEESKKYVDSKLIQTATTTANSLCKYKGVIPTTTSSLSGQQKYPFCSNLAEITPKLVQYLHSGQNISPDAVKNDACSYLFMSRYESMDGAETNTKGRLVQISDIQVFENTVVKRAC